MVSKNDLLLLLTELEDKGLDVSAMTQKLFSTTSIPLDVVKFINDNRQLDLTTFYENLRKNYNKKKSKLYISFNDSISSLNNSYP